MYANCSCTLTCILKNRRLDPFLAHKAGVLWSGQTKMDTKPTCYVQIYTCGDGENGKLGTGHVRSNFYAYTLPS